MSWKASFLSRKAGNIKPWATSCDTRAASALSWRLDRSLLRSLPATSPVIPSFMRTDTIDPIAGNYRDWLLPLYESFPQHAALQALRGYFRITGLWLKPAVILALCVCFHKCHGWLGHSPRKPPCRWKQEEKKGEEYQGVRHLTESPFRSPFWCSFLIHSGKSSRIMTLFLSHRGNISMWEWGSKGKGKLVWRKSHFSAVLIYLINGLKE